MEGRGSSRPLFLRTVLAPLLPPALLLDVTLRFSPVARDGFDLDLGATITSASGESFANGEEEGGSGTREVIIIFAVEVGERCNVRGWGAGLGPFGGA